MAVSDPLNVISLKRRLLSGGAWALAGKAATLLTGLLVNALLARLLAPQDLGAYFLAVSLLNLGATLGSLGLNQVIVRYIAESIALNQFGRARRVVGLVCSVGGVGALGVGLLYLPFGRIVGGDLFGAPALVSVTGLVAGWMMVMTTQILLAEVFRGFQDIRFATIFGGLSSSTILVVCLSLLWFLRGDAALNVVMLLAVGSGLTSALLAGWLLRRKIADLPQEDAKSGIRYRELLHMAWPLLISNLTLFALTQADVWIIGAFRPQNEVAVYGAASRIAILLSMPLLVVNLVVPPLIAQMYAQGRKQELERVLRVVATVSGIPAFVVLMTLILLGEPILGLIYGDYYRSGATVLALLSLGQLVNVWAGSCGMMLTMTGHQLVMMAITLFCGASTLALGLLAVDSYGATGVAAAAAVGLTLQNVFMWLAARATTGIWTHVSFAQLFAYKRTAGKS